MSEFSRKELVLQLITANPFVSQQELADRCGLSRSAVAGHIASLVRERRLLGRAYLLPETKVLQPGLLCFGGCNLDRKLRTLDQFTLGTSNPVSQFESYGGVARNIAENVARLGHKVGLISALGDDAAGRAMQAQAQGLGIDLAASLYVPQHASDTYTAVLDQAGNMLLALAHMELVEQISTEFLAGRKQECEQAGMWLADMNLPASSIAYLLKAARTSMIPLVMVAVSQPKMARLPADLSGVYLLLLNRDELASRLGVASIADQDLAAACAQVQAQGVQNLIVTLGEQGVCYTADAGLCFLKAPKIAKVADVTGAGDAFAAAVCWSLLQVEHDLQLACRRGLTLAALTLQCSTTVCPEIGPHSLALENLIAV